MSRSLSDDVLEATIQALSATSGDALAKAAAEGFPDRSEVVDWSDRMLRLILYQRDRSALRAENPPEVYRENGERCLGNHYRRNYPFDRDESLGIEQHVGFALDGDGRYRVRGIIDRVVRAADGAIEIHDYKTGRWVPSQQELDQDRQLALYQIGVETRYEGTATRLVWHYLLRDQVRVSTRTPEQLEALRARTIELIDRIEAERDFEPQPSALCSWCEFNDVCPAMQANAPDAAPAAATGSSPEPAVAARHQLALF